MVKRFFIKTTKIGWTARVLGSLLTFLWLSTMISKAIIETGQPLIWQSYVMGTATIILSAGVVLGWLREKSGGILLITAGLAFSVFSYFEAGHNEILAFLISGFPFLLTGILFLISSAILIRSKCSI